MIGPSEDGRQGFIGKFKVIFAIRPFNHEGRLKSDDNLPIADVNDASIADTG